eukprot:gene7819-7255_t
MIRALLLLATLAEGLLGQPSPAPWQPSAACQAKADAFCATVCESHIADRCLDKEGAATLARKSGPSPMGWRCYSPGDLGNGNRTYTSGTCYCSRNSEILQVLSSCGDPDPSPPPGPSPAPGPPVPPQPEPPAPKPKSGLPSVNVFWHGQ